MRRVPDPFDEITSLANLWDAWRDFQRGKRRRSSVARFGMQVERELPRLHRELRAFRYRPGPYRLLGIHEPKRRLIAAAPVRDRIVHHAVHRVLAPCLDRSLVDTTFACLEGRGSHRAVLSFVAALRRHAWSLSLDIRHYFPSIDREVLMELMQRKVKGRRGLALLRTIVESGSGLYDLPDVRRFLELPAGFPSATAGLPIGNLTSQWWGNHYLSGLDHFAVRELRLPHYQRYMDDITLFAQRRSVLIEARTAIADWLARERRLVLKHAEAEPRRTEGSVLYLGQVVGRGGARPRPALIARMQRRISDLVLRGDVMKVRRSMASYRGVLGVGDKSWSRG